MSVAEAVFGRIADGELVIIDGGTGTQLQAEGVPMDDVAWSARANLEQPDVVHDIASLAARGIPIDPEHTSYFIRRNSIVGGDRPLLPRWQRKLFLMLARLAVSPGDFFGLPANRVVELGGRTEI